MPRNCQFASTTNGNAQCEHCKRLIRVPDGMQPSDVVAVCGSSPRTSACKYFGEPTGRLHLISLGSKVEKNREHVCNHTEIDKCVQYNSADTEVSECAWCDLYEPVQRQVECPDKGGQFPSLAEQLKNYATATARWVASGTPVRSEEEILVILNICESCDLYDKAQQRCTKCGCNANNGRSALWNKLAMATERCPLGKWGDEGQTAK